MSRAILDEMLEEQAERRDPVIVDCERNWQRHPELRAEFGDSFERYLKWYRHNVTG